MKSQQMNGLKKISVYSMLVFLLTLSVACSAEDSKPNIELTTPIPPGIAVTPTPWLEVEYPLDTRTGIDEIDHVIDAILDKDIEARLDLVRLLSTACTTGDGLGGPPKCQPEEEEGTIVEGFPVSYGEGTFIRPEDIRKVFDFTVRGLFAVYLVPVDAYEADYWPAGEYGIVFTSQDGDHPHFIIVIVENGQIVRLGFNPGWPPFEYIQGKSDDFILPPIR